MPKFPSPIRLPDTIHQERVNRENTIIRSASLGILIRCAIILFELVGVFLFGSSSLLMDALASMIDIASSILLIACIKMAGKPPDQDHPFGHGRYEPLMGLILGATLSVIGLGMMVQQIFQSTLETNAEIMSSKAWLIPFIALILLEICYRAVMHTAKKQNSPALAADAVHYRIDGLTSLFATIALILAAYFPSWSLTFDHLGAIVISVLMIGLGGYAAKKNAHQLMDKAPDKDYFEKVRRAAFRAQGVKGTEKIKIQQYGPDAHVDIDIEVDPKLTVEVAHKISQKVRAEIQKEWPSVRDVTVHIEPYYPNDH